MTTTTRWTTAAIILLSLTASLSFAETLLIDGVTHDSESGMPARGMTMGKVESKFGAPLIKHAAVGDPPISRWEYSSFIVYFEYQRVLHTVSKRQARAR